MKKSYWSKKIPMPSAKIAQVSISDKGIGYVSGLISQNPDTGEIIRGTVAQQTEIILSNLKNLVEEMGLTMDCVIKCNVFISSMEHFNEMHSVYEKFFSEDNPPARQAVAVEIWGNLDVEISAEIDLD